MFRSSGVLLGRSARVVVLTLVAWLAGTGIAAAAARPARLTPTAPAADGAPVPVRPPLRPQPVQPADCDEGYYRCTVLDEIMKTEAYLRNHRLGMPYTPDPREASLTPYPELVRLLINSQAIGYLNLHQLTNDPLFLQEARLRLDHIIAQGEATLRHASYDGHVGWTMLRAFAETGDESYRAWGMKIADACLDYQDNMNTGYMAAMALGAAYALTGNPAYLAKARSITRNTSNLQFPDGAFPHQGGKEFGENASYTAWLVNEMIVCRRADPANPDIEPAIIPATDFLERRISADGSISYEDENGVYDSNPGGPSSRGWMSDPPGFASALHAIGKDDAATRTLQFLFQHQLTGDQAGSYPDKWESIDPNSAWENGNPSVVRTSVIFSSLTDLLLIREGPVPNGTRQPCAITPDNCHPVYEELGLCGSGYAGYMTTIDGTTTRCLNVDLIRYDRTTCTWITDCRYDERDDSSDAYRCVGLGERRCVGTACSEFCIPYGHDITCERTLIQGDVCPR